MLKKSWIILLVLAVFTLSFAAAEEPAAVKIMFPTQVWNRRRTACLSMKAPLRSSSPERMN